MPASMNETAQLWAVEWNPVQKMPHIEPLFEYVLESRVKMLNGEDQEWVLVGVEDSHDAASRYSTYFEKLLKKEGQL